MTCTPPAFTIKCVDSPDAVAEPPVTFQWHLEKTVYMGEHRLTLRCQKFVGETTQGTVAVLEITPKGYKKWVVSSGFFPSSMIDGYRKLRPRN